MKIIVGGTRIVVLTNRYAIKLARFKIFGPAFRFARSVLTGTVKEKLNKYDSNPAKGSSKYFWEHIAIGLVANRAEYLLYREHGDCPEWQLAPTVCSLFGGLINVQKRGETATPSDVKRHPFFEKLVGTHVADEVLDSRQFCVIDGRVHCVDYGFLPTDPRQDVVSYL